MALKAGKASLSVLTKTGKIVSKAGKVVAVETSQFAAKAGKMAARKTGSFVKEKSEEISRNMEPLSEANWYGRAAQTCEAICDALLREKKGVSSRIVKGLSAKLGFAGTGASIFSIASLLGTASTGTAIGSLSGAAFNSAALAWVGGSVAVGSAIVLGASLIGGLGALLGVRILTQKLTGKKRAKTELSLQEQSVLDVCLSLAVAFREQETLGHDLDSMSAQALYVDALIPLCDELIKSLDKANAWPVLAQRKLRTSIDRVKNLTEYIYCQSGNFSTATKNKALSISTGVVSAVIIQLLADDLPKFSQEEGLVLEALRRSNNSLTNASNEELATYIQNMEPVQISGLSNNIKGIYHELAYQNIENSDGDNYVVELFETTNHAGADIRIINTDTNEVKEVQLKATKYMQHIREHNEKYENIEIFATSEVATGNAELTSTGFSNEDLTEDVSSVFSDLDDFDDPNVIDSMTVAAMITLAKNAGVLLKGEKVSNHEKENMIKDGAIAASVAGLVHLIL